MVLRGFHGWLWDDPGWLWDGKTPAIAILGCFLPGLLQSKIKLTCWSVLLLCCLCWVVLLAHDLYVVVAVVVSVVVAVAVAVAVAIVA